MKKKDNIPWFASWFDSPFYHILYDNHDFTEAHQFIENLIDFLQPEAKAKMLDLACGKGRHSIFLAEKGFDVIGIDLSAESIATAKSFEHDDLKFETFDMRLPFRVDYFDYVFNIFTSFGYFDNDLDHLKTLQNISIDLKKGGIFIMDYFNTPFVLQHLISHQERHKQGINFDIHKKFENGFIHKTIAFEYQNQSYEFAEHVRAFTLQDFEMLFEAANLEIIHCFGDYQLNDFNQNHSERLILVATNEQQ